jgi:hypothetical protein
MADQVRVNGNVVSWGSIVLKIGSDRFHGFTSISYGDKRERVHQYGMGKHQAPRGKSRGKYTVQPVKIGGPKSSVQAAREQLAALSSDGVSYGDVEFEIDLQYIEANELPMQVNIEGCTWEENTSSEEESSEALKEEFSCLPMKIRRNGLVLFDNSEGSP